MTTAGISVIICCYNSSERLPETLRHLALQQVSPDIPWEILVIDNASTDYTAAMAASCWKQYKLPVSAFTILHEQTPGKNAALKTGVENAVYNYVLICDDDNRLSPGYVEQAFHMMEADKAIGALGGRGIFEPELPVLNNVDLFQSRYVNGKQTWAGTAHWVYGAGATYRKSVFADLLNNNTVWITPGRVGDKLNGGEDVEICFLMHFLGYKIVADDNLSFNHFIPHKRQNEDYLLELSFWQSWSNVLLYSYYHLFNRDERPIKKVLYNWLLSAAKTRSIQVIKSLIPGKRLTTEQKITSKNQSGTFYSLLKNRKRIAEHHLHLKDLLSGIDADKLNSEYTLATK